MRLKEHLKALYLWFLDEKSLLVRRNIDNDKNYLEQLYKKNHVKLKDPENYLLRSFLQYQCQMHKLSWSKKIVLNLISPFLMIVFIPYALLCACFLKARDGDEKLAIINGDVDDDLIPGSLQEQYQPIKCRNNIKFALNFHRLMWIMKINGRYILYPYFIFKLTVKIAQYSYLVLRYRPKIIITTSEYSFCSSALTGFCEQLKMMHINVMHGEKCFNIRDSFFKFSRCYVWDDYYIDLFKALKADINKFVVERPPKHLKIMALGKASIPLKNTIKFCWASEYSKEELIFISKHLKRIREIGFNITVRYHPLHKTVFYKKIYPFLNEFKVEDPTQVPLYNSLLETEYVLGTYTTVLYEGYLMNRKIIINDFNYSSLLKLRCISIHLSHSKLSEFKG